MIWEDDRILGFCGKLLESVSSGANFPRRIMSCGQAALMDFGFWILDDLVSAASFTKNMLEGSGSS
jgi:hypothetical protein